MENGITKLPDADHVEGVILEKGPTPQTSTLKIQYRNARTGWCELEMNVPNGLYLLNVLEALSAEHDYDKLRRSPD